MIDGLSTRAVRVDDISMAARTSVSQSYSSIAKIVLTLSTCFVSYGLIQPLLSLYTADFVGMSVLATGFLISSIGIAKAAMDPVSGFSSDRYGRKRISCMGALALAIGLALTTVAENRDQLLLGYVLHGSGQGLFFSAIMTSMSEISKNRGAALGIYEAVGGFSVLAGSIATGFLVGITDMRTIFGISTLCMMISLASCALLTRETLEMRSRSSILNLSGLRSLLGKNCGVGMYAAFLFMFSNGSFTAAAPFYLTLVLGLTKEKVPLIFVAMMGSAALGSLFAGALSERTGRRRPIIFGSVLACVGFTLLAFVNSFVGAIVSSLICGFGDGVFHPVASAVIGDVSTSENRGRAYGFYRLARDLGMFAGPAAAGVLTATFGVQYLFMAVAAMSLFGAFLGFAALGETLEKP
jgi:MFS family permease